MEEGRRKARGMGMEKGYAILGYSDISGRREGLGGGEERRKGIWKGGGIEGVDHEAVKKNIRRETFPHSLTLLASESRLVTETARTNGINFHYDVKGIVYRSRSSKHLTLPARV